MPWRRKTRVKPVTAARLERERSERSLAVARAVIRDLHHIRQENHYKDKLKKLIEGAP